MRRARLLSWSLACLTVVAITGYFTLRETTRRPSGPDRPGGAAQRSTAPAIAPATDAGRVQVDRPAERPPQPAPSPRPPAEPADRVSDRLEFPPEYTGIRDENLVQLYSVFRNSMEVEGRDLEEQGGGDSAIITTVNYLQMSAYVALIQSQRLHYYGYESAPMQPDDTKDVEYRLTGMGAMQVVFRLSREDFPDLFEAKDRLREWREKRAGR